LTAGAGPHTPADCADALPDANPTHSNEKQSQTLRKPIKEDF